MIERGNTIKVGFKWWYGGAHRLATELGFPRTDIVYSSGDITGQDYSTNHYLLYIFAISTLLYISESSPDYKLFRKLLFKSAKYFVAKAVNFFGNMWRVVVGTMPSGHYVTSHANSYILSWLFWSYVYAVHMRNPLLRIFSRFKNKDGFSNMLLILNILFVSLSMGTTMSVLFREI
jgi:hypothetical protein